MKTASPSPARAAKALSRRHSGDRRTPASGGARRQRPAGHRGDQPRPRAARRRRARRGRGCGRSPTPMPPASRHAAGAGDRRATVRARRRAFGLPHGGFPHPVPATLRGARVLSEEEAADIWNKNGGDLHRRLPAGAKASGSARRHLLARAGPSQHRRRPVAAKRRLWRALAGHGRVLPPAARDAVEGKARCGA